MSDHPSLDEILALERGYDDLPPDAEERILRGIEAALDGDGGDDGGGDDGGGGDSGPQGGGGGAGMGGGAGVATKAAPWLARAAYVAVGVVAGASGHAILSEARAPSAPHTLAASPATASAAPEPSLAQSPTDEEAEITVGVLDLPDSARDLPVAAKPTSAPSAPSAGPRSQAETRLAEERADLDVARVALSRGRIDACLEAIDRHARTYGEGHFAEEREVIAVQALVAGGRQGEAAARARRFHERYPSSLFGSAMIQAVSPAQKP